MNTKIYKCLLIFFSIIFSCTLFAQPLTDTRSVRVINFFLELFRVKELIINELGSNPSKDPRVNKFAEEAFERIDAEELSSQLAEPFSKYLLPSDIKQCLVFIESKDASALIEARRNTTSATDFIKNIELLDIPTRKAINNFYLSDCITKSNKFFESEDVKIITQQYGKNIACKQFEKANIDIYKKLVAIGECNDASAPSASPEA